MPTSEKSSEQVIREERRDIEQRRRFHRPKKSTSDSSAEITDQNSVTGLALSGGGIRAAAFSLGFIQAMYRAGRMKGFDYLSTVSGGGYTGGLFSAMVAKQKNRINWERDGKSNRLDIETVADGSQPDSVRRLALHGRMMTDFLRLFSCHFWGFLVNVTFALSGLVAIAAILAFLMRVTWHREVLPVLKELGFQDDISVSFFCAFLALQFWIASHLFARLARLLNREIAPITQYTYVLLLASVVLSGLTVLAIGDISLGSMFGSDGNNARLEASLNRLVQWLGVGLTGLFATSLLPYLSPKRLLASGQPDANRVQSLVFRSAGNALVIGAPLFVFFFLVKEDISSYNRNRPDSDQLTRLHLNDATGFANKLESHSTSVVDERKHLARRLYSVLNNYDYKPQNFSNSRVEVKHELEEIAEYFKGDEGV